MCYSRSMFERIRSLAEALEIRDGQLVKLARDIAHDVLLRDLEYLTAEQATELEHFLVRAVKAESRLIGVAG